MTGLAAHNPTCNPQSCRYSQVRGKSNRRKGADKENAGGQAHGVSRQTDGWHEPVRPDSSIVCIFSPLSPRNFFTIIQVRKDSPLREEHAPLPLLARSAVWRPATSYTAVLSPDSRLKMMFHIHPMNPTRSRVRPALLSSPERRRATPRRLG